MEQDEGEPVLGKNYEIFEKAKKSQRFFCFYPDPSCLHPAYILVKLLLSQQSTICGFLCTSAVKKKIHASVNTVKIVMR